MSHVGGAPSRVSTPSTPPEKAPPVGLAVVGAGYWGPNLVRNALSCPATTLHYVCDTDIERARKVGSLYAGVQVSSDLSEVLADPRV